MELYVDVLVAVFIAVVAVGAKADNGDLFDRDTFFLQVLDGSFDKVSVACPRSLKVVEVIVVGSLRVSV